MRRIDPGGLMQETWKPVSGYHNVYEISDLGRVRSLDRWIKHSRGGIAFRRGKVFNPRKDKNGYLVVTLRGGGAVVTAKVHRIVAKHFLPPSDLPQVNHLDFDKTNNAVSNLEWTTGKSNLDHASASGRFTATISPKRAKKLSSESATAIRAARSEGMSFAAIGAKFGIRATTAWRVTHGELWALTNA